MSGNQNKGSQEAEATLQPGDIYIVDTCYEALLFYLSYLLLLLLRFPCCCEASTPFIPLSLLLTFIQIDIDVIQSCRQTALCY